MRERQSLLEKFGGELIRCCQRLMPRSKQLDMSVQKTVPLGQKAVATLLDVNGERLLLGVTSANVTLIQRWQKTEPALQIKGVVH